MSSSLFKYLLVIGLFLIGCNKHDDTSPPSNGGNPVNPPPPSSEKKINSVVFKQADNPGFTEDIIGAIVGDSIKIKFPANTPLNSLIPTINFSGVSISPTTGTAQNFSTVVVYRITAQDGSTRNFSFSSSYRNFSDTITMIQGRWGVIKDSVTNINFTFSCCGYPIPGVYIGVPADYYDFSTNGTLYLFENNNFDQRGYQVLPNARMHIVHPNYYDCDIQYLSATRLTLYWNLTSPNGGRYTRTLWLKQ